MSKFIYSALMFFSSIFGHDAKTRPVRLDTQKDSHPSIYDFKMKSLDGELIDFSRYKGKKLLIVNTASECGFTPQYADLEKLHEQYGDKITILGFPSNDFGEQEPGTSADIKSFCSENYGIKFQMFEKVDVIGENQCALYKWLTHKDLNGWNDQAPVWNFNKYLIGENGELLKYYPSKVSPLSADIIGLL